METAISSGYWKIAADWAKTLIISFVLAFGIRIFAWQTSVVEGASMAPNLATNDRLGVDKVEYRLHAARRGDVIVFRYPKDESQNFVKRVIGLPGEKVKIKNGTVTIYNAERPEGFLLNESAYLPHGTYTAAMDGAEQTVEVPPNSYFVMGDNRPFSSDSRTWGCVPEANIVGRALLRLFPLNEATAFGHQDY